LVDRRFNRRRYDATKTEDVGGAWSTGRVHGQAVGCGWDGHRAHTGQQFEGTALGDQIVFTTQLLKGDTEAGYQGGVCTVTSVARGEAQCIAIYALRGGQITGQALIRLGDPAPYAVAVTGGSGKYEGVEGEVRVDPAQRRNRGGS
jgi:hypothetical protein